MRTRSPRDLEETRRKAGPLSQKIEALRQHMQALQRQMGAAPTPSPESLSEVFEDLHATLDELERAQQELLHQHAALTKAYQTLEQELEKEQAQTHHYLKMADIIFLRLAADQTVTWINHTGCTMLGYAAEELIGQNWFDTCLPVHVREEVRKIFQQLMAGELAAAEYYENSVLTRNGEERLIAWHNALLKDEKGRVLGTLSAGVDITEQQTMLQALQEEHAKTRAILETAVDGIITIDEQGIITLVNPAAERIFGYTAAEMLGQNIGMLMPSPYREEHDRYLAQYLATGQKKILGLGREVVGLRKDGTTFPLYLAVSEVQIHTQRWFTGIVRDLTEPKRMEQKLLQTEKFALIGEVASGLAHEIGTPLGVITGTAEYLLMETTDPEIQQELAVIISQTDRISTLIRRLLTFARPQEEVREQIDIHSCIERALRLLEYRFRKEQIQIIKAFHPAPLVLWGVSHQLEQVLLNLFVNAWHAMPEGGTLTISTARQPPKLVVQVQDTGHGIPPNQLSRIFEPFFTTKNPEKGTGLGLFLCQQIIGQHEGSITVESAVGKGSLFTILLPLAQEGTLANTEP